MSFIHEVYSCHQKLIALPARREVPGDQSSEPRSPRFCSRASAPGPGCVVVARLKRPRARSGRGRAAYDAYRFARGRTVIGSARSLARSVSEAPRGGGDSLEAGEPKTTRVAHRRHVMGRLARPRFDVYGSEARLARAVLEWIGGLDPGAVRLAATVLGLLPSPVRFRRRPSPAPRGEGGDRP